MNIEEKIRRGGHKYVEVDFSHEIYGMNIEAKPISHKSPPKNYPKDRNKYADEKNYKYPVDTESRVRSALSYWGNPKNREGYSPEEIKTITEKIHRAAKKFGINVDESKK